MPPNNGNPIVPTRVITDSSNAAADTAFVQTLVTTYVGTAIASAIASSLTFASVAQIQTAAAGNLVITATTAWQATAFGTGSGIGSGTVNWNLSEGINFSWGLTGSTTFTFSGGNNGNVQPQCGIIYCFFDGIGDGSVPISFSTSGAYPTLAFPNNVAPTVNTASNTIYGYVAAPVPPSSGQIYIFKIF